MTSRINAQDEDSTGYNRAAVRGIFLHMTYAQVLCRSSDNFDNVRSVCKVASKTHVLALLHNGRIIYPAHSAKPRTAAFNPTNSPPTICAAPCCVSLRQNCKCGISPLSIAIRSCSPYSVIGYCSRATSKRE